MQPEFAFSPRSETSDLGMILVPGGGATPLSKAQTAFKRLVKRIEKLRREIDELTQRLNRDVEYFAKEIQPRQLELGAENKTLVRLLFPFLRERPMASARRNARALLTDFLRDRLSDIASTFGSLTDPDLQQIFETIEGQTLQEAKAEDFNEMRQEFSHIFGAMGVDIDLSHLRPDMSDAEMAAEMAKMQARIDEKLEQDKAERSQTSTKSRPKTKKQIEKEAREREAEEMRKRDLGSLYRQLAKLLHPDLEQDAAVRAEKEVAMKELTTAYKNNDLHALLRLELAWITREDADASRLTDAKLAVYNQVLKEQIAELEMQRESLPSHPRYYVLDSYRNPFHRGLSFNGPMERASIIQEIEVTRRCIRDLQGPASRKAVIRLVEDLYKEEQQMPDWLRE